MGDLESFPQPGLNLVAELLHMAIQLASCLGGNCLQNGSLVLAFAEKNFVKNLFFLRGPVLPPTCDQLSQLTLNGPMTCLVPRTWLLFELVCALLVERDKLEQISALCSGLRPLEL